MNSNRAFFVQKLVGALALALAAVQAQAIPLSSLFQGEQITAGDKLFDDFILIGEPLDPELGEPIDLDMIEVTAVGDGTAGNEYGLNFDLQFSLGSQTPDEFDFLDLFFGYSVTAMAPGKFITGVAMTADAASAGADAFATVVKTVTDTLSQDLLPGFMEVFSDTSEVDSLAASAAFSPQSSVLVRDNIALFYDNEDGPGTANLNSFQQRFIQRSTEVPVPATLLLVLLGLAGVRRMSAA